MTEEIIEAYRICQNINSFSVEARVLIIRTNTIRKGVWPIFKTYVERTEAHQWHAVNRHGGISSSFLMSDVNFKTQIEAEQFCEYLISKNRVIKEYTP